jgi:hypothetical protein
MVLSTGEIRPSLPGSTDKLLGIDRVAVTQSIDPHARLYSDIGVWSGSALLPRPMGQVR